MDASAQARAGGRALGLAARVARVLLLGALAAWALWVALANAFLWTPLLRAIVNASRPTVELDYRAAWSLVPGLVYVRGLTITSQDRAVQWHLAIERASTTIAVWQLPARAFHATSVRASGVRFVLRRRIPKPQVTAERVRGIPLVPGLDPMPYAEEGPDDELPDWRYRLFTIWLENVEADDVREIWVDKLRVAGAGNRLTGSFYLKPIRRVDLEPGALQLGGAAVEYAGIPAASGVRGDLRLVLHPFDPRGLTSAKLARIADADLDLSGRIDGLEFLAPALPVSGGAGPMRIALRLQAGQILPGSSMSLELRDAFARVRDAPVRVARTELGFEAPEGPPPHAARAAVRISGVRIAHAGTIATARAGFEGDLPDLASPRPPLTARLVVEGGHMQDARAAAALVGVPESLRVEHGRGDFSLDLSGPVDGMRGKGRFVLSELELEASGVRVAANLEVRAAIRSLDPARGADLDGTRIDVDHARVVNPGGEEDTAPDWWAHLALPRAALRQRALDADLVGRCRDARPLVGLYVRRSRLPGFLAGLFAMDDLAVRGSSIVAPGLVVLRDATAEGDGASVRLAYRKDASGKRGAALLDAHGLTVGVELGDGGSTIHLGAATDWFRNAQARLQTRRALPPLARAARPPPKRGAARVQTAE